jgi:hypothetical protein
MTTTVLPSTAATNCAVATTVLVSAIYVL